MCVGVGRGVPGSLYTTRLSNIEFASLAPPGGVLGSTLNVLTCAESSVVANVHFIPNPYLAAPAEASAGAEGKDETGFQPREVRLDSVKAN